MFVCTSHINVKTYKDKKNYKIKNKKGGFHVYVIMHTFNTFYYKNLQNC